MENTLKHDVEAKFLKWSGEAVWLIQRSVRHKMRFFDLALNMLRMAPIGQVSDEDTVKTDGETYYYNPEHIVRCIIEEESYSVHEYLHTVIHCIYRHIFWSGLKERRFWDLACDIAVENVINEMAFDVTRTSRDARVRIALHTLANENVSLVALNLYEMFMTDQTLPRAKRRFTEEVLCGLEDLFRYDDHSLWYEEKGDSSGGGGSDGGGFTMDGGGGTASDSALDEAWKNIAQALFIDLETNLKQGTAMSSMIMNLKAVTQEKYDYTAFLKKFAVRTEVMKVSPDEFDYNFYTYGLELYGNMPLIEPLEYREDKRVREFVIAIDTSGSTTCSADMLAQKFVTKTYNILMSSESFARKVNIYIIQCDAGIQRCDKITCKDDFENYIKNMKLYGGGGTDFRPVFDHVDKMVENGEFKNLKGLIYFTDGYGTFPSKKPTYETAFVFVDDDYSDINVPTWAIKLKLRSNDIKSF